MHNHIVALLPVDRSSDSVLVAKLQGVNHPDNLVKVPTSTRRVGDCETDNFLGVNHEDSADLAGKIDG